jgi:hypothetical protein
MMKKHALSAIIIIVLLLAGCQSLKGTQANERRPDKEKSRMVTIEATVEEIDLKERLLTLRGASGDLVTLKVDDSVKRLNEIKPGDTISADYWTYILSEFRQPTPEEEKDPLVVHTIAEIAPPEMPPGAGAGVAVRAVVTVTRINLDNMRVTIKGPRGNYATLLAEDESLLKDLKVGEIVVLTYVEAVALSIKKTK